MIIHTINNLPLDHFSQIEGPYEKTYNFIGKSENNFVTLINVII